MNFGEVIEPLIVFEYRHFVQVRVKFVTPGMVFFPGSM